MSSGLKHPVGAAVLSVGLLFGSSLALAEDLSIEQEIEAARTFTEANRQAAVAASLGLPEDQMEAFWTVYRDYRSRVKSINDELQALIFQYAEDYAELPDEEAYQLARDALELQVERDKLKQTYLKRFARKLSKRDAARLIQVENKLDALGTALLSDQIPLILPR